MSEPNRNIKRLHYLDLVRGLAVFFMVMQHAMIVYETDGGEGAGVIGNIFVLLGTAPAAPVFMIIMGFFIGKSKSGPLELVFRGFKLLVLAYGLNLLRFTIPMLIAGESDILGYFLTVDIFHLAGLSFIVAAGLRRFMGNLFFIPLLIIAVLLVSPHLWGTASGIYILDLFWGIGENVAFPFFPWCIYPLLGMYSSPFFIRQGLDRSFKRKMIPISLALGVLGFLLTDYFPFEDYSRLGFGASLLIIAFVFLWLMLSDYLTRRFRVFRESRFSRLLFFWSKNITHIYIIQWVLFGWSTLFLDINRFDDITAMFVGLAVMFITHLIVRYSKIGKMIPKI